MKITPETNEPNNPTITKAINAYDNNLSYTPLRKTTIKAYQSDIAFFVSFIRKMPQRPTRIRDISRFLLNEYCIYLAKHVNAGTTKGTTADRRMVSLKSFYSFLVESYSMDSYILNLQYFKSNYFKKLEATKHSSKPPYLLSEVDIDNLLSTIEASNDLNKHRDYALIKLLCATGARRVEIINLKWEDINFIEKSLLLYRDKTQNTHKLLISDGEVQALKNYKNTLERHYESSHIFKGRFESDSHISPAAFHNIIKKWAEKAGLPDSVSAHSFRHFFINTLQNMGVDATRIIHYTGHSSLNGLKPYTHFSTSLCVEVVTALNRTKPLRFTA